MSNRSSVFSTSRKRLAETNPITKDMLLNADDTINALLTNEDEINIMNTTAKVTNSHATNRLPAVRPKVTASKRPKLDGGNQSRSQGNKKPLKGIQTEFSQTINDSQINSLMDSVERSIFHNSPIMSKPKLLDKKENILNNHKPSTPNIAPLDCIKKTSLNKTSIFKNVPNVSNNNTFTFKGRVLTKSSSDCTIAKAKTTDSNRNSKVLQLSQTSNKQITMNKISSSAPTMQKSSQNLSQGIKRSQVSVDNLNEDDWQAVYQKLVEAEEQANSLSQKNEATQSKQNSANNEENSPELFSPKNRRECRNNDLELSPISEVYREIDMQLSYGEKPSQSVSQNIAEDQSSSFRKPAIPANCKCKPNLPDEKELLSVSSYLNSSQCLRDVNNLLSNVENTSNNHRNGEEDNNNWNNDTFNTDVVNRLEEESQSFSSFLKDALQGNISKSPVLAPMVNHTVVEEKRKVEFHSLGPYYDLPIEVKNLVKQYKGIEKLYDWQDECLKLDAIKQRKNLIYALPTSGGKTLVAEILMMRELLCRKRDVLFILPYVAIVQEKVWELSPFAVALNFLVDEYAAGRGHFPPRKRRHKHSIYVATIEKSLALINSLTELDRLNEIGLVVVDELHLVGEGERGAILEHTLTKLMYQKEDIQIIGMSATIGNIEDLCKFLNSEIYTRNFRPVELTEYIMCNKQIAKIDWKAKCKDEAFVFDRKVNHDMYTEAMEKIDPDHLAGLILEVIPEGSCLVFCASKKNCENVARLICKIFNTELLQHKQKERLHIKQSMQMENGDMCPILNECIPYGVAYHHSGLTSDERRLIEDGFRNGALCVICCTSTLAAGVNLPAKRVIIRSPYVGKDLLSLSRYKQMVGRAGRAGYGEIGESIMICNSKDLSRARDMLLAPMDKAMSQLLYNDMCGLRTLLLSSISLGTATNRSELRKVVGSSLLAVQSKKMDVDLKSTTDEIIRDLFKKGALRPFSGSKATPCPITDSLKFCSSDYISEEGQSSQSSASILECSTKTLREKKKINIMNDTKLIISKLGKASIKSGLSLHKSELLYDDLMQAQKSLVLLDCLHLLYLVTPYDASDAQHVDMNYFAILLNELNQKELKTANILGINELCRKKMMLGQQVKTIHQRVLKRFYFTLVLHDLWNGSSVYEVSEKYKVARGTVQQLMTSASAFSLNVVYFCEELEEFWMFCHIIRAMSERLQHCCTKELVPLMELPSVKQGRAKQLYKAGYINLQSIAKANPNDLMTSIDYMTRKLAYELIAAAKLILITKAELLREQLEEVMY